MRFLVDECMPYSVVQVLENYGFDVLDIASSNYRGAKDRELVEIAIREERVILTKDVGYSIITFQKSLSGLWMFRVPNFFEAKGIGLLLKDFLEKTDVKDLEGKLVILSPGKIRIRPLLK